MMASWAGSPAPLLVHALPALRWVSRITAQARMVHAAVTLRDVTETVVRHAGSDRYPPSPGEQPCCPFRPSASRLPRCDGLPAGSMPTRCGPSTRRVRSTAEQHSLNASNGPVCQAGGVVACLGKGPLPVGRALLTPSARTGMVANPIAIAPPGEAVRQGVPHGGTRPRPAIGGSRP